MDVDVSDRSLKRTLEDDVESPRRYGAEMAKKIQLRLEALRAAESLADFWPPLSGPERCHSMKGDLAGLFSLDLKHPFRLLLRPTDKRLEAASSNEKERWASIKAVTIVDIEDTHG